MQKILHVLRIIVKTLLCAAAGILLIYNVLAIAARLKSDGGVPTVFGFAGAAVVSGSMEPTISVGDFIVTKAQDGYFVGDVVMYYDSARGETVTHRIIAAENGWFVTQGDANNVPDDYSVPQSAIVGKVVLVVGGAGNAIRFLQSPAGFFAVIGCGVILWVGADIAASLFRREKRTEEPEEAGKTAEAKEIPPVIPTGISTEISPETAAEIPAPQTAQTEAKEAESAATGHAGAQETPQETPEETPKGRETPEEISEEISEEITEETSGGALAEGAGEAGWEDGETAEETAEEASAEAEEGAGGAGAEGTEQEHKQ